MWGTSQAGCPTPTLQHPQPVLPTRHPVPGLSSILLEVGAGKSPGSQGRTRTQALHSTHSYFLPARVAHT